VPGGLPPQLVKLTHLSVNYATHGDTAEQFQHLNALTALQQLSIEFENMLHQVLPPDDLSGIADLTQLTSLELSAWNALCPSLNITATWTQLTALHSLRLDQCVLQPSSLPPLTQLRSLKLEPALLSEDDTLEGFLVAVSRLTLLTQLHVGLHSADVQREQPPPPAAAFNGLTASTHLCSLDVDLSDKEAPLFADTELFTPGTLHPHLRRVNLDGIAPSEQQLQRLCSCCPALESLAYVKIASVAATACLPLLKLSALTHLQCRCYVWVNQQRQQQGCLTPQHS
jgi:hypothetical protein